MHEWVRGQVVCGDYVYPYEEMCKGLSVLAEQSIFSTTVVVMNVSMALGNHSIWRKLSVPLETSFIEFHRILQIVFARYKAHHHEFYLFQNEQDNCPKLNIVIDKEALEPRNLDVNIKLEEGLLLTDFIPSHSYIKYIYDFGDDWQHDVIMEEVQKDIIADLCRR